MDTPNRRIALGLMLGGFSLAGLGGRALAEGDQEQKPSEQEQAKVIDWIEEIFQNGRLFESQAVSGGKVSTFYSIYLSFDLRAQLNNSGHLNLSMAGFPEQHGLEDFHDCERNYEVWKQEKFETEQYRMNNSFSLFTTHPDGELRWFSGMVKQNRWDERRKRFHRQRNACEMMSERRNFRLEGERLWFTSYSFDGGVQDNCLELNPNGSLSIKIREK